MSFALEGTIVPLRKSSPKQVFGGRVYVSDAGRIAGVKKTGQAAPSGYADATVVSVGDAFIFPGLIDLHSHIGYNANPLWHRAAEQQPYLHHDIWPGRDGYKQSVGWPAWLLARGAPEALMVYVQVRALAGGTTTIQGWPSFNRSPANQLVRNADDQSFADESDGEDNMLTSTLTIGGEELQSKVAGMAAGKGFIYHCAEGQKGSKVVREFEELAQAQGLREKLILIHCCAVTGSAFESWRDGAEALGEGPGAVVWSPFSNLWLYGRNQTTEVPAALEAGVTVCLGTDWGPSGTKNLLGELKAARLTSEEMGWSLSDFDLVQMVTAAPGDVLSRVWGKRVGRLVTHGVADVAVVSRGSNDPWATLVNAHEEDVQLVLVDGTPRYGTRSLMRSLRVTKTTAVRLGDTSRHIAIEKPTVAGETPDPNWTWTEVLDELEAVRENPTLEFVTGPNASGDSVFGTGADPGLIIELDMPGSLGMLAGPPPAGVSVDIAEIPSLRHDRNWRSSVKQRGFHEGIFDGFDRFY